MKQVYDFEWQKALSLQLVAPWFAQEYNSSWVSRTNRQERSSNGEKNKLRDEKDPNSTENEFNLTVKFQFQLEIDLNLYCF